MIVAPIYDEARFSALQRAENSSNRERASRPEVHNSGFSALQRAENSSNRKTTRCGCWRKGFSALQRAENSSNEMGIYSPPSLNPFQCSSASRKFLKRRRLLLQRAARRSFQCSSASRKFLKHIDDVGCEDDQQVSVLFSEPKIPQRRKSARFGLKMKSFSALQRAENSSKRGRCARCAGLIRFQCSSASRKFLKLCRCRRRRANGWRFQCSSASRKFLKSAVQTREDTTNAVSVLFSEPKIPQNHHRCALQRTRQRFQCSSASRKFLKFAAKRRPVAARDRFSALQRAENSSKTRGAYPSRAQRMFQCSSASRKFLKPAPSARISGALMRFQCSSASRKFLKRTSVARLAPTSRRFSALQRAENSSNTA